MMDRQLKQRVVGAGLLVAFGVIFIPIFLDNGGVESPVPPAMNIPPAPTEDVSQRAPALGEDAIAAMENQADEDVELPPSRVQSGEGSNAEPAPTATPSAGGEPPATVEILEEGVAGEPAPAESTPESAAEMVAPRMQPPMPRPVTPSLEPEPAPANHAEPVAEPPKDAEPKLTSKPVAKPVPVSKPAAKAGEAKPSAPHAEPKAATKPVEPAADNKAVARAVEAKAEPKPVAKPADTKPDTKAAAKAADTRTADLKPPPAVKPVAPAVGGWTVQPGSFSSDLNAKKLVDKLKAAGYKAYTEPRLEQGVTVFKVRVGPTPGKAEAERLRQRIEAQFEARGMLVPSR